MNHAETENEGAPGVRKLVGEMIISRRLADDLGELLALWGRTICRRYPELWNSFDVQRSSSHVKAGSRRKLRGFPPSQGSVYVFTVNISD